MRRSRSTALLAACAAALALTAVAPGGAASAAPAAPVSPGADPAAPAVAVDGVATEYVVLYKAAGSDATARAAITRAGGRVVAENAGVGYAVVTSSRDDFAARVDASGVTAGAARDRVVGSTGPMTKADTEQIEKVDGSRAQTRGQGGLADAPSAAAVGPTVAEPLAGRQWDMRQIGATTTGSYRADPGRRGVMVGIIDTGVDGSHPDIAPNFDAELSHNFTVDMPSIDGPCEYESCVDPADHDDNGHGTHVASTIGSPANGIGIAGVAPNVTLVNLRAGQDSGYFFLQATLEALTYAGDIGVDVVNMSYYVDPWLYNCVDNPADSPAEQSEQRVVRTATQRAVNYARGHGVLPVSAEGNGATDLGHPVFDDSSPDFPEGVAHPRDIDNSCITVPTETAGVVAVSAVGPSGRKSYFSDYGVEQTDVAAPGGDAYDTPDRTRTEKATVLAAMPTNVAQAEGVLNPDGTPNTPFVLRDCKRNLCAYYQYLQGTSMASPHAAGVAALIVGHFGGPDRAHGGLTLSPTVTESYLNSSATRTACPSPRTYQYTRILTTGEVVTASATCEGGAAKNGFYGHGIVNAYSAVTQPAV